MDTTSTVLISKLSLCRKLSDFGVKETFGIVGKKSSEKEWDILNFQFILQVALDNCVTYTSTQSSIMTGILNSYIYK